MLEVETLTYRYVGAELQEQLGAAAEAAAVAAAREGRAGILAEVGGKTFFGAFAFVNDIGALPGLCSEVAQAEQRKPAQLGLFAQDHQKLFEAAALRGAAKLGVPEDQANGPTGSGFRQMAFACVQNGCLTGPGHCTQLRGKQEHPETGQQHTMACENF